jgi:uncharacterized circularly permuted ATP-grasp superfamily protein/uncharacterized alpha-E superfamily protein
MTVTSSELLRAYRPVPGAWDEMVDADGGLRPSWSAVASAVSELGLDELARRQLEADRMLDDDGVTYHVLGEPEGRSRRWRLDPLPVVVTSDEWASIERGAIQRAELLDAVLADVYGPRELLRRRLLPAPLVLGHPGFLRALDQVRLPGAHQLFTAAFDLGRDADGRVVVLADRTQAPSGAGYALENRVVTSRVLPSLYRETEVHRLAPFFRTLRAGLEAVAPPAASEPRIVVLTPGALSETAFEHAYLASYLGYPLVEGSDLVMRDGRIWLRSLGRREPVDVILRRVDAGFCDPLELGADSQLGVPGLVEACRLGTVSVVNTLGSGVLENPGLLAFLPTLAEKLLGQPLRLPSITTHWCGDPEGLRRVVADPASFVLKPVASAAGPSTVYGWLLSRDELDEVRRRIEAAPEAWVAQEPVELASTPTVTADGLTARSSVLRAFVVARGDSFAAMPGGLTRVAADDRGVVSNQAGAISKDTWVLASEPEPSSGWWLRDGPAVPAIEPAASMPSRAAENLFWLGRYAERAEGTCRLLRVVHDRRNEFANGPTPAGTACVHALLGALTHVTTTYPGFLGEIGPRGLDAGAVGEELRALTVDHERPGSLAHAVRRMLDAAYAVRDQLSNDTWLVVADLDRDLLGGRAARRGDRAALGRVMRSLLALAGLGAESMVRDPGWRFLEIGRRLERALQLLALLRAVLTEERDTATDSLLLESVLTAAESIITYRRRYRSHAQLETVLDLLLLDPENPRSVAFQVHRLAQETDVLPGARATAAGRLTETAKAVLQVSTQLRLADTRALAAGAADGTRPALDAFLRDLAGSLLEAGDAVTTAHFTHLLPQRSFA